MTKEIQKGEAPADPWSELDAALEQSRAEFFRAFGLTPFGPRFGPVEGATAPKFFRAPRIDVADTGASYRITADLPGVPKEQLDVRVRGTTVEIRGDHATTTETKQTDYVHQERTYAGFYRSLEMPEPVVAAEAKAKVENGVLELELPKLTPTPSSDEVKVAVA